MPRGEVVIGQFQSPYRVTRIQQSPLLILQIVLYLGVDIDDHVHAL